MRQLVRSALVCACCILTGGNALVAAANPSAITTALDFSGYTPSSIFELIWGPGSNDLDMSGGTGGLQTLGGGLNYSTKPSVGWSASIAGKHVTSFSLQSHSIYVGGMDASWVNDPDNGGYKPPTGDASYQFLARPGRTSSIALRVPKSVVLEVWDLETMQVVAANHAKPGRAVTFTAKPNVRYGGFAWYADNRQAELLIRAAYIRANPPVVNVVIGLIGYWKYVESSAAGRFVGRAKIQQLSDGSIYALANEQQGATEVKALEFWLYRNGTTTHNVYVGDAVSLSGTWSTTKTTILREFNVSNSGGQNRVSLKMRRVNGRKWVGTQQVNGKVTGRVTLTRTDEF